MPQRSPAWHLARKGRITASEAGRVLTATGRPSKQAAPLLASLQWDASETDAEYLARVCPDDAHANRDRGPGFMSGPMSRGIQFEGRTLDAAAFVLGLDAEPVGCVETDWGLVASPDGVVLSEWAEVGEPGEPNPETTWCVDCVLEIKTPEPATHDEYRRSWGDGPPAVPTKYLPQIHAQMIACECDEAWLAMQSYEHSGRPVGALALVHVKRDAYTDQLEKALREFAKALKGNA